MAGERQLLIRREDPHGVAIAVRLNDERGLAERDLTRERLHPVRIEIRGTSGTTQSWLPANGRSQKTSSSRNPISMAGQYARADLATLDASRV